MTEANTPRVQFAVPRILRPGMNARSPGGVAGTASALIVATCHQERRMAGKSPGHPDVAIKYAVAPVDHGSAERIRCSSMRGYCRIKPVLYECLAALVTDGATEAVKAGEVADTRHGPSPGRARSPGDGQQRQPTTAQPQVSRAPSGIPQGHALAS